MKTKKIIALTAISLTLFACDKDEDKVTPAASNNSSTQNSSNSISFGDADGTLIAVKSVSNTGFITITIGTAVGTFYDNGSLVDVGAVSVEGTNLTKNGNNSYTATASATNPTGITFSSPINWTVGGANGFNGFTEDVSTNFPSAQSVNSLETVDKSDGYTLSTSSITNSDSVLFSIGNVTKIKSANTTSCTFTSAELSGLANGTNVASIAPYNFSSKTFSGKKVYFVNEYVVQKTVTIQN